MSTSMLLRQAIRGFRDHDGPLLAAAMAFYVLLALAPLGLFAVLAVGAVYGEEAARGDLFEPLNGLVTESTVEFIATLISRAQALEGEGWATTVGAVVFLVITVRLFVMLRASLNHIFGVRARRKTRGQQRIDLLLRRVATGAMVLVFCAGALGYVAVRVSISSVIGWIGLDLGVEWRAIDFGISTLYGIGLTALFFRYLPDVRLDWADILVGAAFTGVVSAIGGVVIAWYLVQGAAASLFGAAGAPVVILLWFYYTSQLFFFGAEFTAARARDRGGIEPRGYAEIVRGAQRLSIEAPEPPPDSDAA